MIAETQSFSDLPDPAPAPVMIVAPPPRAWYRRWASAFASGLDWAFGLLSLVFGLAIFSVVPLLNFLSLGYLIHASGRVAATGKLRAGFVGVRKASRLGSFIIGAWLISLPAQIVSSLWKDAELVAPDSTTAQGWRAALIALTVLTMLQIVWACLRGGRLRHFLWPAPKRFLHWLRTPDKFLTMRNAVVDYMASLRLPYYFWLGARAFLGALLWLAIPVGALVLGVKTPADQGGGLFTVIGGFLLMLVAMHLPFLQTRFALENRFRALFELRAVRQMFQRAPVAFWLSLFITLLFALPLYLLKIELPPREIAWMPSLLFVIFIFPARLLTGWAVGRALRRETPRHWFFRWSSRLAMVPTVFFYVLLVYLTQYLSWNGSAGLFEQHAFMTPAPLTSL
jgi:hypothetical protein